jgi:hypothetical protein
MTFVKTNRAEGYEPLTPEEVLADPRAAEAANRPDKGKDREREDTSPREKA